MVNVSEEQCALPVLARLPQVPGLGHTQSQ